MNFLNQNIKNEAELDSLLAQQEIMIRSLEKQYDLSDKYSQEILDLIIIKALADSYEQSRQKLKENIVNCNAKLKAKPLKDSMFELVRSQQLIEYQKWMTAAKAITTIFATLKKMTAANASQCYSTIKQNASVIGYDMSGLTGKAWGKGWSKFCNFLKISGKEASSLGWDAAKLKEAFKMCPELVDNQLGWYISFCKRDKAKVKERDEILAKTNLKSTEIRQLKKLTNNLCYDIGILVRGVTNAIMHAYNQDGRVRINA